MAVAGAAGAKAGDTAAGGGPAATTGARGPTAAALQADATSEDRRNVDVLALAAEYKDWDYANTTEYPPHPYRTTGREDYGGPVESHLKGLLHFVLPIPAHVSWGTAETNDLTRHWRVAFKRPVKIGSLVGFMGPVEVSYLRADVQHPGDIRDASQWTVVPEADSSRPFRLVTFPPDVQTTAVRFTLHLNAVPQTDHHPRILGIRFMRERIVDWSPTAVALASSEKRDGAASRLVDGSLDFHRLYGDTNWDANRPESRPLSPADPAWAIIRWRKPVLISAVYLGEVFGK
jgi:hypothetical protein